MGVAGVATPAASQAYSQQQQQLCSGDAMRLCSADIPNVDRITACMMRQRAQLSPGCRSVFRPVQASAPVPMRVAPKSAAQLKAAKARQARKLREARRQAQ
jgi:hypothetical protein